MAASSLFLSSKVGKARSSNFTLSEKLDLLKLVRPARAHPRGAHQQARGHRGQEQVLGHCGRPVQRAGGDRPQRAAQGLRTLYKRLKESAKQEMMQRRHAQPEYRGSISEPTRRVMEMIPQLFHHAPLQEKEHALRRYTTSRLLKKRLKKKQR